MSSFEEQENALLRLRIVRLEAQVEYLYKHLNITFIEDGETPTVDVKIMQALNAHNVIEAIKLYRAKTGVGLAEAKSAVEAIMARREM
jgi:ribosomal protein L7/L12